jgi:hypothetical protein
MKKINHLNSSNRLNRQASGLNPPKGLKYANGDVDCIGWQDRIDMAVCITRNLRQPKRCRGCKYVSQ